MLFGSEKSANVFLAKLLCGALFCSIGCVFTQANAHDLEGMVVDERGVPVANARVDIYTAKPRFGVSDFCPQCYRDCVKVATTDESGRFFFRDVDDSLLFCLIVSAQGKQTRFSESLDSFAKPSRIVVKEEVPSPKNRQIDGRVIDENDNPIPGAVVDGGRGVIAIAKNDGTFVLHFPDENRKSTVLVTAEGFVPRSVPDIALGTTGVSLKLSVGAHLTGQVRFKGEPVAGMVIRAIQVNKPMYEVPFSVEAVADEQGKFEIGPLPAKQAFYVDSPICVPENGNRYVRTTQVETPANGKSINVGEVEVTEGLTVSGSFTSRTEPLPDVVWLYVSKFGSRQMFGIVEPSSDGEFEVTGLRPGIYELLVGRSDWEVDTSSTRLQQSGLDRIAINLETSVEGLEIPIRPPLPRMTPDRDALNQQDAVRAAIAEDDGSPQIRQSSYRRLGQPPDNLSEVVPSRFSLSGRAIDETGKPISGVAIYLRSRGVGLDWVAHLRGYSLLAQTKSAADGTWEIDNFAIPLYLQFVDWMIEHGDSPLQVIAVPEGRAIAWHDIRKDDFEQSIALQCGPSANVQGQVRDASGQPVSGLHVRVFALIRSSTKHSPRLNGFAELNLIESQIPINARTDKDGRFSLPLLPQDTRALVQVYGNDIEAAQIWLDTNSTNAIKQIESYGQFWPVQHLPLDIEVTRVRQLSVRVEDIDGSRINEGIIEYIRRPIVARDGIANYGFSNAGAFMLDVFLPELNVTIRSSASIDVKTDGPIDVVVYRPKLRKVMGHIVDAVTGRPIQGVLIHARSRGVLTNEQKSSYVDSAAITDAAGAFALHVVPGQADLSIRPQPKGYLALERSTSKEEQPYIFHQQLEVPADGEIASVKIRLQRGVTVLGKVVRPNGKPVAEAFVTGSSNGWSTALTDDDGRFMLSGLAPNRNVKIKAIAGDWSVEEIEIPATPVPFEEATLFYEANLVAWPTPNDTGNQRVQGIVVDINGEPIADAYVRPYLWRGPGDLGWIERFFSVQTNIDGQFDFEGLPNYPIVLRVSLPRQAREMHHVPAVQRCLLNQKDVRVVIDSDLVYEDEPSR